MLGVSWSDVGCARFACDWRGDKMENIFFFWNKMALFLVCENGNYIVDNWNSDKMEFQWNKPQKQTCVLQRAMAKHLSCFGGIWWNPVWAHLFHVNGKTINQPNGSTQAIIVLLLRWRWVAHGNRLKRTHTPIYVGTMYARVMRSDTWCQFIIKLFR